MENITISKEQYNELLDNSRMLDSLYSYNVTSWELYEIALEDYYSKKKRIAELTNEVLKERAKTNRPPDSWFNGEG